MKTLLIVDDEVLMAEGLRDVLREAFEGRLNVLSCCSAKEALAIAGASPVDILLTDINMPDTSGLELHEAVRRMLPDCAVIYLTGYSEFEYARHALDQRAFAYILKGEGDERVIDVVGRALEKLEEGRAELPEPDGEAVPEWVPALHGYISEHLDGDLSLNRLAEYCHFHPVYLSRAYKEITNATLSDTINQARQERAEQLLRRSDYSVHEISVRTGFATDNYFCRWFRKRLGMSPHTYRERERRRAEHGQE